MKIACIVEAPLGLTGGRFKFPEKFAKSCVGLTLPVLEPDSNEREDHPLLGIVYAERESEAQKKQVFQIRSSAFVRQLLGQAETLEDPHAAFEAANWLTAGVGDRSVFFLSADCLCMIDGAEQVENAA